MPTFSPISSSIQTWNLNDIEKSKRFFFWGRIGENFKPFRIILALSLGELLILAWGRFCVVTP